jgi:citronellol/citronellal dehydrogenase
MPEPAPTLGMTDVQLAAQPSALVAGLLTDRVVVVSGGGSGIGRATAWLAARLGAQVVICGRRPEKLAAVAAAIGARGLKCVSLPLDIRERARIEPFFAEITARFAGLDLLINSAGGQYPKDAIELSERAWQSVIDTNLTGTFAMMQAAARCWRTAGRPGSIVSIVVSPRGLHQVAHSVAARAGVMALSGALAVEWAPLSIRVNCVAPGAIASEGWAVYPPQIYGRYGEACPLRRTGTPWEIAEAALFVGGPGGAFITGQTLHVNGGSDLWGEVWTAGKPSWFVSASRAWQEP